MDRGVGVRIGEMPVRNSTRGSTPGKPPLVDDRGRTDRVIATARAGLRRCCWPRPRHAARLAVQARSR